MRSSYQIQEGGLETEWEIEGVGWGVEDMNVSRFTM